MTQVFVPVTTKRCGTICIQLSKKPYDRHGVVATNGVANVVLDEKFKILVANFGISRQTPPKNQVIAEKLLRRTAFVLGSVRLAKN